ncbi:hypothetical protein QQ056_03685 [Oscillatoria laete-virens NRMC-F 0139]|nr:hypothetical protein [Oscillatoria laete-virens]MDL5052663.1 hypothetical protein [Oscillatoria laete-virens NRMC-F 0139]
MRQTQNQEQRQLNLQLTDDTWERLLCALERLEYVTDKADRPGAVATRLDQHEDRGDIRESEAEVELEVHLQIMAFSRVVAAVREDAVPWLLTDFACWMAGRSRLPLNSADDYAIPVLKCILGEKFSLPKISDLPSAQPSGRDIKKTTEQVGVALHQVDKIVDSFSSNPDKKASQHRHERGAFADGMDRIKLISEKLQQQHWFKRYCGDEPWKQRN